MYRAAILIALACLAGCGGEGESGGVWISPLIGCADSESGSGYSVGRFDLLLAEASGVYDAAVIDGGEGEGRGRRRTVIVRAALYGAELPDGEAVLELDDVDGAVHEERCPALVVMSGAGGFSRTVLRHYGIYQDNIFSDNEEPVPCIETLIFCDGRPSLGISSVNEREPQAKTPVILAGWFYIAESGELLWGTNDYHGIKVFRRHALARAKAGKRGPKPGAFAAPYTLGAEIGEVRDIVAATRDKLLIVGTAGLGRCSYDGNGGMEQSFTGIRWDERPIEVVAMYAGKGAAPGVAAVFKDRLMIWDSWAAGVGAEIARPIVLPLGEEVLGLSVIRNGVQPELLISTSGIPLRAFRDGRSGSWSVEPLVHITASGWRAPWEANERAAAFAEIRNRADKPFSSARAAPAGKPDDFGAARPCVVADFDKDGIADVVQPFQWGGVFYRGTAGGGFQLPQSCGGSGIGYLAHYRTGNSNWLLRPQGTLFSGLKSPARTELVDFDLDGAEDILIRSPGERIIWLNQGNGYFSGPEPVGANASHLADDVGPVLWLDFLDAPLPEMIILAGDGPPAILANCYGDLSLTTVALPDVLQRHAQDGVCGGYVGDFDCDGRKDMFLITRSGQVIVLMNARGHFGAR